MYTKKGNGIPDGTLVYYTYGKTMIDGLALKDMVDFTFDPNDGLWVQPYARAIWKKNPELHPHVTLFTLLYKKLGI